MILKVLQTVLATAAIAGCSSGSSPPPAVSPPPPPSPPAGTVSGVVQYEIPPPRAQCNGLNFNAIQVRPIRRATVQAIDAGTGAVLASTAADDNGAYSLSVTPQTNVFVRVRAELKNASPSWDVEVRNNVIDPDDMNPPALKNRPIYTLDGSTFNTGSTAQTRNLLAASGWGGSSYTEVRSAAPFAVLDAIYSGMTLVLGVEPAASFPPLDAFWSPDNTSATGGGSDLDTGELGTSFYDGETDSLFLLGMDGVDTEEFDSHVIVHEWGHYFEDVFSRSDSIGGSHGLGDLLDMRVAFGEGFATALSGMALDSPSYCDSLWSGNGNLTGFEIDIESENAGTTGWFNESSVMKILYDLWDLDDDGADNSSIGFRPIFDVMTGAQANSPAFTSLFSFATYLKEQGTGQDAFIDALLDEQNVNPAGLDIYGSGETNDGPGTPDDVLPVYTQLALGDTVNICTNSQFDAERDGNKLSQHRYLTLSVPVTQDVTLSMVANPAPSVPPPNFDCESDPDGGQYSDPDLVVWRNGEFVFWSIECTPNAETPLPVSLPAGDYTIDINEFRFDDTGTAQNFPGQVCFDFSAN